MQGMFYCLKKLINLDISELDTSKVEDISFMFFGWSNLTFQSFFLFPKQNKGKRLSNGNKFRYF